MDKERQTKDLGQLLLLLKPYWPVMLGAAFLSAATVFANVGLIGTSAVLISLAALQPPILDLMMLIVAVRFFGISRAALRYAERYVTHNITLKILSQLRLKVYQAIEPLMPAGLAHISQGQLLQRITKEIEILQFFYLRGIAAPLTAVLVGLGSSMFLWFFSPPAAMVLVGTLALAGIVIPGLIHKNSRQQAAQLSHERDLCHIQLVDYIKGIGDLQGASALGRYDHRLTNRLVGMRVLQAKLNARESIATHGITYLSHVALWASLIVSIPLVEQGRLSAISLAMVILVVWSSFEAIIPLPQTLVQIAQSRAAAKHIFDLLRRSDDFIPAQEAAVLPFPLESTINFEAVDFAYQPDVPLFQNLNLRILAGQKVAIVGASGSGKSTLIHLLLGMYKPDSGHISIGGKDIGHIQEQALYQHISVMDQSTYLFNATIRENLLLANPKADEKTLWQALERAHLAQWVNELPKQLETSVGENGMKLSGGQRQRMALARMFLQDGDIIVLDEATQGLDTLTSAQILQEIAQWTLNKTTITITHSLKGLATMDQIIVLERGQIKQIGCHHQLLAQEGLYARMFAIEEAQF